VRYRVVFSAQAKKALKKLDRHVYATIVTWIRRNLEGCDNPRLHGKGLTANRSGQWRYRIGDYRLIADIQDDIVVILIVTVGHRRDVYD
jgi:addiction module toxin, relE/stbE family